MSGKSGKIAELIQGLKHEKHSPHYLGYFECFNRELYFEAHDVLEELWLQDRQSSDYSYFKGLIQLAGAFVHLQKNRLRPAAALFRLARDNLLKYPSPHHDLNLEKVLEMIESWLKPLEDSKLTLNQYDSGRRPALNPDLK